MVGAGKPSSSSLREAAVATAPPVYAVVAATTTPRWPPAPSICHLHLHLHHCHPSLFVAIHHPTVATRPRDTTTCQRRRTTNDEERRRRPCHLNTTRQHTSTHDAAESKPKPKDENGLEGRHCGYHRLRDDDDLRRHRRRLRREPRAALTTTLTDSRNIVHRHHHNGEANGGHATWRGWKRRGAGGGVVGAEEGGRVRESIGQGGGQGAEDASVWAGKGRDEESSKDEAMAFFQTQTEFKSCLYDRTTYYNDAIAEVLALTNGDASINIIISTTETALIPIFYFHSTAVMNYISPYGIFCAYPKLTFNLRNMLNPLHSRNPHDNWRLWSCVDKYRARGFSTRFDPIHWDDMANHVCETDYNCPTTMRTTFDEGCLFFPFPNPLGTYTSMASGIVVWCLGGFPCGYVGQYIPGYVDDFDDLISQ
ncbi:hypothetical protein D9613_009830 [Agrocybe pediades]|uniref:Uncharacterized protein n=1 Tax=Agrocybe pediades TaxID=84607 RepID=A0A8H4VPZ3_9AGAR|nr:hypothetical protein D9613_009830 [Agrocybe pediades]